MFWSRSLKSQRWIKDFKVENVEDDWMDVCEPCLKGGWETGQVRARFTQLTKSFSDRISLSLSPEVDSQHSHSLGNTEWLSAMEVDKD